MKQTLNCKVCNKVYSTYKDIQPTCSRKCGVKYRKPKTFIPNVINLMLTHAEILLNDNYIALIDLEDVNKISMYKWIFTNKYVLKSGRALPRGLHNIIMGHIGVDHINGNTLDNRKCNLRPCNTSSNLANQKLSNDNTSGYKGVSKHKGTKKWQAKITVNENQIYLGTFANIQEAVDAYDKAAIKYFGDFALTNKMLKGRK